jgi:cytochrome c oxidase subunit I+III
MESTATTPRPQPRQGGAGAPRVVPELTPDTPVEERLEALWADPPGFIGWFRALQNDALGGRIMLTAFTFFLLAGIMALLMRLQLVSAENTFLDPQVYNGLFTMHGSTMMFLFAVPMLEGFAIYLLPLLLGNREMPFPRLGVFSFFTFAMGGILFFSSFLFSAVPDTGWFAYVPLSGPHFSPGLALDFWLLGLGVAEIGAIAAGIEIIIAIMIMRAPGMTLSRMPILAWAFLITAFAILFAFMTLLIGSMMLELDRKFGTHFFDPTAGGSPLLWQHLFWVFGHPEVYIQFIPAAGMVSMIISGRCPDFRMADHDLGRPSRLEDALSVCHGLLLPFCSWRNHRCHGRRGPTRLASARFVFCRSSLSLRSDRRRDFSYLRGTELLVAQVYGQAPG